MTAVSGNKGLLTFPQVTQLDVMGSSSKTPVAKPDGTKMFCSAFLNDARMCCFFGNTIVNTNMMTFTIYVFYGRAVQWPIELC